MKRLLAVVLAISFLSGCAKSYRTEFEKLAKKQGWTKDETLAAYYYSLRLYLGKEGDDKKFTVLYSRLPMAEVSKQADKYLNDLSEALSYNDPEWNKYIDTHGLRKGFEHDELVFKAIRDTVRTAELNSLFRRLVGETSPYSGSFDEYGYNHDVGYDGSIFKVEDLKVKFPFENKVISEAKARGVLVPVETFTVSHYREYDRKEPDPNYPDEPNKFVWRSAKMGLEVKKYKIIVQGERPDNNYGDYLEAYRVLDGKKETEPALRAFLDGKAGMAVAVIDVDKQDQAGFSLPDLVESVSESRLMSEETVAKLFPDDKKSRRVEPKLPPIRVEIAKAGASYELWETSTDPNGWGVPFTYWSEPWRDNYNVRVVLKNGTSPHHGDGRLEVEYFTKEWTSGSRYQASVGRVVEYYLPKDPFDKKLVGVRVLHNENTKKLSIILPDGNERVGLVTPGSNVFIKDKPTQIAYTLGENRWLIRDEDGDGKYEKRRKISESYEVSTGSYPER